MNVVDSSTIVCKDTVASPNDVRGHLSDLRTLTTVSLPIPRQHASVSHLDKACAPSNLGRMALFALTVVIMPITARRRTSYSIITFTAI